MSREQLLQKILLIDVNSVDRALTIQALTHAFPEVDIAEIVNGDELAQAIASANFDLVITDYQLPWTTGLDILRSLKAQMSDCPVIMFTNSGSEEIAVTAMKAGLDDYVIKSPANLPQLVQAVITVWQTTPTHYQTAQALKKSERRLSTLISNLPGYVYRVANDRNYTPEFISEGVVKVTGYSWEEYVIERTIYCGREIHPDDRDRVWKSVQKAVARQQPYEFEFRIITKSGTEKWVWERGRGIFSDSGELLYLEGFVTDISARKAVETALQESQQLYQTLVENSPDIIERFDTQLRHLYTSPALTKITGIPAELFFGRTCREIGMPETMVHTWEAAVQTLLTTGQKQIIEFATPTLYGIRYFEMAIAPELTHENVIKSILCISRDVSERKADQIALQQKAQQAQTLNRVVQSIRSSLDLTTIFSTTIAEVTELLGVNRTTIVQYFPERECWQVLATHRQDTSLVDTTGLEIPDIGNPYAAQLKQLQVVQVNTVESITDPINQKISQSLPPAWLLTPIVVNGKIWGSLSLSKAIAEAPWKQEEIELATKVADQLAIAIQQAQLYQQAQQELRDRQRADAALQQLNQELEQRVQERSSQLQMALSAAKMGTWELNPQTKVVRWSPQEYELFGFKTDAQGRVLDENGSEISPFPTFELFLSCVHPEDRDYVVQKTQQAIQQGATFEVEYRLLRRAGCWLYARGACVLNAEGKAIRLVGVAMDITNRKRSEEIFRHQARQEQVLRLITQEIRQSLNLDAILTTAVTEVRQTLQADRVAVYQFNPDWSGHFIVESVTPGWLELVQPNIQKVWVDTYLQETQGGRYKNHESFAVADIYTIGHQDCHIALLEQFQARAYAIAPIFSGDDLWGLLAVYQNSAPRHWLPWEMELLQHIANQLAIAIQQSGLYQQLQIELQERQQIEEQIRASLKEKEVLLREVYHRVKNNMQMVSSLLNLQASTIDDPTVLKLLTESQRRVKTMALIHERLYRSENLARIHFASYVEKLVKDIVRSYTSNKASIRISLDVSDVELDLDTAVTCGLIINELVSNALKYAFPQQAGEIALQFWLDDSEHYCLVVKDNGIGVPGHIDPAHTTSLGMQLIYGLTEQLGGKVQVDRQGGSQFTIILHKRV
ncbi:GAF domain-containing protein [Calothrix sp. FACHB-1219]|uniref:GAF domain-containing protein n=1 Tax=unclassified Calothrix TaxID=2619626 RepID=UPI00168534E1|nr:MULTISPECIES: GAF domain-containing protein [unclassified Calothrix]MBD2206713.1 GAF domain-containing protein [Calothrix sp. FACHB-168]MBD2219703.1 GAF domain-containing protein [Calothrix sp. FACHB-1219]